MSFDSELSGLRHAIDTWYSTGSMSADAEKAELRRLIARWPSEARTELERLGYRVSLLADPSAPSRAPESPSPDA